MAQQSKSSRSAGVSRLPGTRRARRFVRNAGIVAALGGVMSAAVPAVAGAATASTSSRPSVTFSFVNNQVSSGTQPELTYSARNLPRGSGLYLQWQYGSANAWTYLQTLPGATGTVTVPADPAGVFAYRIRALDGPDVLAVSAPRFLWVAQASGCDVCQIVGDLGPVAAALIGVLFG
ncbi:MAG TPA: hypothetical protein VHY58_00390 [Streptosporangiaceae bacterium]|jgi:hypothetical protein|nr:hypothetical protein [Streptosporangiaceae bacterium]